MNLLLWHKPSHKQLVAWKEQDKIQLILCVLTDREAGDIINSETTRFPTWQHKYTIKTSSKVPAELWDKYRKDLDILASKAHDGNTLLIHCAAGIHRTGVNGYAILRRQGFNRADAYKEVVRLRPQSADCIRFLDWADAHLL